ncbi:response regulator [Haliangium ochraceum]|uniref:Response regulator receiver and Hpt phospho transfer protein n=1 Tax=Haliangium ochraceum (strain DSM 14365 / JCM 11303 / SMP-2) TaxID=502025 RepID=D0LUC4_HALO1|nr:response regulator [Haliangium ochraceum]ACY19247.1 response regulator receiver and Hpt phospho transfer protein [Haliangium ochraceum DSM 14365]
MKLEELRERFRERFIDTARQRMHRCLDLLSQLEHADALAVELHSLAGEAAMLGLYEISETARDGEKDARAWQDGTVSAQRSCARAVRQLRQQIEAFAAEEPADAASETAPASAGAAQASATPAAAAEGDTDAAASPARTVLVVDDSALAIEELADALAGMGFEVHCASNLEGALAVMRRAAPSVVLTDVQMPELTPEMLCRAVREAAAQAPRIVLMSGRSDEELAALARATAADAFVSKQHGTARIVAEVERVCGAPR